LKIKVASRSTTATAAPTARKKFLHRRVAWSCFPQCAQANESATFGGMLVTSSPQKEHLGIFNYPIMIESRWKPIKTLLGLFSQLLCSRVIGNLKATYGRFALIRYYSVLSWEGDGLSYLGEDLVRYIASSGFQNTNRLRSNWSRGTKPIRPNSASNSPRLEQSTKWITCCVAITSP
jgi:hypothetical protein